MGTLYLVRHGQASFGAADYDVLSDLGHRQCQRLGEYFAARNLRFDAVLRGTLRRHRESLEAIAAKLSGLPEATLLPGLNEYDSPAVLRAVHPEPLAKPDSPAAYKLHIGILRKGLAAWIEGRSQPQGMSDFKTFQTGVAAALDLALPHVGGKVLMVTSGGPISTAVGLILNLAAPAIIELNMRSRNSGLTEISFNATRHALLTYNTLPHLDHPECADWVTHT